MFREVSFFSGCGGLELGFKQAGFNVIWANDNDPECLSTYVRNHPNTEFVLKDLSRINIKDIPECEGFIGGPPCQSWSIGGKQRGIEDKRGKLFLTYIELISIKRPKFFVIENVKGILDKKFEKTFEKFIRNLSSNGYKIYCQLLNAADYKIPQNRERVFIIGIDLNIKKDFNFPKKSTIKVSLKQAIGDINIEPNFFIEKENVISQNPRVNNHDVLRAPFGEFYRRGNRLKKWDDISFTINATAAFCPLHPDSPPMIFNGYQDWQMIPSKLNDYRRLSVRECGRIQSFPDTFIFDYTKISQGYRMVGNAVPPRLGKAIGNSIKNVLLDDDITLIEEKNSVKSKEKVLIGYYRNSRQLDLVLKNRMYYVRYGNRPGSIINKTDANASHLLLHHGDNLCLCDLASSLPVLVDHKFLKRRGFKPNGQNYLLYILKDNNKFITKTKFIASYISAKSYKPYFIDANEFFLHLI